jgi:hypothetical protein
MPVRLPGGCIELMTLIVFTEGWWRIYKHTAEGGDASVSVHVTSRFNSPATCMISQTLLPNSADSFLCSVKHFTDFICSSASSPTNAQRESSSAISEPAWSKEALFGLLGVLFVIVVPLVGFLLRYCVLRRGWLGRSKLMRSGTTNLSWSLKIMEANGARSR